MINNNLELQINQLATHIKILYIVIGLGLLTILLGVTSLPSNGYVQYQGIEIVDRVGKPVLRLSSGVDGGGVIAVLDDTGKPVIAITAEEFGGRIRTFTKQLKTKVDIYSNAEEDGQFLVNNRHGNSQMSLSASDGAGLMSLIRNDGTPAVVLSSDAQGGRLQVLNNEARPTIEALNSQQDDGQFYVRRSDGNQQVALAQDKKGSGTVIVYNVEGKISHYFGMHPSLRNGMVMIANKQGKPQTLITSDQSGGKVENYSVAGKLLK